MSRWFRFYDDAVNDPKVQRLPGEKFKCWINFLCMASKNDGILPTLADLAFMMRTSEQRVSNILDEFFRLELLDAVEFEDAPMGYAPHNWKGRQFKSDVSNERVKRYRERKCNVTGTVTVTPPETEQIQSRTDTVIPVAKATRTKLVYSEDFETRFWKPFPRTPIMSKQEAWREWAKLDSDQRGAACLAIEPYRQHLSKNPTLQAVHACRFLSQKRAEGILEMAAERPKFDARAHML